MQVRPRRSRVWGSGRLNRCRKVTNDRQRSIKSHTTRTATLTYKPVGHASANRSGESLPTAPSIDAAARSPSGPPFLLRFLHAVSIASIANARRFFCDSIGSGHEPALTQSPRLGADGTSFDREDFFLRNTRGPGRRDGAIERPLSATQWIGSSWPITPIDRRRVNARSRPLAAGRALEKRTFAELWLRDVRSTTRLTSL